MIILFYAITIIFIILFILIIKSNNEIFNLNLNKKQELTILITFCLIASISQILLLNINYPLIGHDYSQVEARAISMLIYYNNNGLDVEWASPLFGGGLLSYANPNWHQYSPLYFLTLIMPFWYSYNILTLLFTIIGFLSIYILLKKDFKLNFISSLTGAVFFTCTGYYIFHIRVGHWTFIYHPLTALIILLLFSDYIFKNKVNYILRILLSSLILSAMIFGGAIHTIFFYTCFTLLGIAAIFFEFNLNFIKKCISVIIAAILSFVLSCSKAMPMFVLSSKIDRGRLMLKDVPFYKIFEAIYYNFLLPPLSFIERLFSLDAFIEIDYRSLWEKDLSLPFIILPIIIIIVVFNKKSIKLKIKNNKLKVILFLIWIYMFFDMYLDWGIIHSIFPFLNKMNLHLRIASTTIIPIIIIFSCLINNYKLFNKNKTVILFLLINAYTIFFFIYRHGHVFTHYEAYSNVNIITGIEVWKKIKNSKLNYVVSKISPESESKILEQFLGNNIDLYSSQFPYEPIYGYGLETFKPKEAGSVYKINSNYYNFTHPNSLLFFNYDYPQFTGFSIEQKEDLDKFLSFKKVYWKLPKIFYIANNISLYSHIIIIFLILIICLFDIFAFIKMKL